MKLRERDLNVIDGIKRGLRLPAIGQEFNLNKLQTYFTVKKLQEKGIIERSGYGTYRVLGEPAPVQKIQTFDIEESVALLLSKIDKLRPVLLLHKDLFDPIEDISLMVLEQAIELKKRSLTEEQWRDWLELTDMKRRALELARMQKSNGSKQ